MPIGDPYASVAELEARLGRADDGSFSGLLDAASRAVEAFTGRQFNREDTATARQFRPVDLRRLPTDDFYTTTDLAVETNGTAWDVADVEPRPWNGTHKGMAGWPFFDIIAVNRTWPWNGRRAVVTVTARWGWEEVPEAIRQATLDVASLMSYGIGSGSGLVKSEAIHDYSVSYQYPELAARSNHVPPEMAKAAPYRRLVFGVA